MSFKHSLVGVDLYSELGTLDLVALKRGLLLPGELRIRAVCFLVGKQGIMNAWQTTTAPAALGLGGSAL